MGILKLAEKPDYPHCPQGAMRGQLIENAWGEAIADQLTDPLSTSIINY